MTLTKKATSELKTVLIKVVGSENLTLFSDEDINDLGVRLLKLTAIALKRNLGLAKSS